MLSSTRIRAALKIFAVALALALPAASLAVSSADARVGGGSSSGSRGSRTFAPPPSTKTAPTAAQPMQRTITQPGVNAPAGAAAKGGLFSRTGAFLRASWAELQRVQWPDRRQVGQATAVVLGFVVVAGLYLGLADALAQKLVDAII